MNPKSDNFFDEMARAQPAATTDSSNLHQRAFNKLQNL